MWVAVVSAAVKLTELTEMVNIRREGPGVPGAARVRRPTIVVCEIPAFRAARCDHRPDGGEPDDLLLFGADKRAIVLDSLSRLRAHLGERLELYDLDLRHFAG